jgi:LuxR family maltose regulon positive regulatory protein
MGLLRRLQLTRERIGRRSALGYADVAQYCVLAQALINMGQSRHREAASELEPLFAEARRSGANLLAIRSGAILAVAHLLGRNSAAARRAFQQVLDLAEPANFIGSIADTGPEIAAILDQLDVGAASDAAAARRMAFVESLRATCAEVWGGAADETRTRAHELKSLLSPREREILELIAEGQSNKAIARRLGLGPETVKTHLKNVFAKLGVERRTQAVLRAEELGFVTARPFGSSSL